MSFDKIFDLTAEVFYMFIIFRLEYIHFFFTHIYSSPASGQAVVTGVVPFFPLVLAFNFFADRVQQSHCSSIFHGALLTHALLALSASQLVHKKKSSRINTSMHSGGFKLTKLAYSRFKDNLIRHRGDRSITVRVRVTVCDIR